MEITSSNSGPVQPRRQSLDERIDITRINRDGIQDATEDIAEIRAPQEPYSVRMQRTTAESEGPHGGRGDRIELSEEGKRLAALLTRSDASDDAERKQRVEKLAQEHRDGRLNTPERIERAAVRMLEQS